MNPSERKRKKEADIRLFNELPPAADIERSMSRAGTPTDNATMEAINGWGKDDLYMDFSINDSEGVPASVGDYVAFFNEERPAFALGYLTQAIHGEVLRGGELDPGQTRRSGRGRPKREGGQLTKGRERRRSISGHVTVHFLSTSAL